MAGPTWTNDYRGFVQSVSAGALPTLSSLTPTTGTVIMAVGARAL